MPTAIVECQPDSWKEAAATATASFSAWAEPDESAGIIFRFDAAAPAASVTAGVRMIKGMKVVRADGAGIMSVRGKGYVYVTT